MTTAPKGYTWMDYKACADQGMSAPETAIKMGLHITTVYKMARNHGFRFRFIKRGRPLGSRKPAKPVVTPHDPEIDLSAIEQMLSYIAALPVAKRDHYRTMRVNHGVPHETAVAILA